MSRNKNLNQFDDLIDELTHNAERPSLPPTFKTNLRRQLLEKYEKPRFFWENVWQWAGTAVALGGLAFIIVYAWSIISQPPEAGDTVAVTRPATLAATTLEPNTQATATAEANATTVLLPESAEGLARWPIEGEGNLQLLDVSISNPVAAGQPMLVHFSWQAPSQLTANYTVSAHLIAQNGELLAQVDGPLEEESVVYDGIAYINTFLTLWPPENAAPGSYSLTAMVYNSSTGEQLKQDNNKTELYLYEVQVYGASATLPDNNANNVWLVSAIQHARNSVNDPIVLDITIGYQVESDEAVTLEVLYAPSDWDSLETAPHPVRNLQERTLLPDKAGVYTFTFTESAEAMRQFVGTDHPVIVLKLASEVGTESNGAQAFNVLATVEAAGFVIDLTRTEAIKSHTDQALQNDHAPNDVWLISVTQQARTSASDPVMLEVTVGYQFESDEEIVLKPWYANPDWVTSVADRVPIDGLGDEIVLEGSFGNETITFVEDPNLMRTIVGTDQPVLVMQMGYIVDYEDGRREFNILAMPTFTDYPIDLTSTEEITYQLDMSSFESVPDAVVSGTEGNGLTLRSGPNGQDIGVLEEGSVVLLNDEPRLESEGLIWQSVSTTIGIGWVVADFLEYPEGYTPAETIPFSPDSLWIVKATQLPRSNPNEAITLEVTVGYELVSADEAVLNLSFVHPTWGVSPDGYRYPNYNALGDEYAVQSGIGSVTFNVTIEPETITSAINSNEFGLITRLWETDENGRLIFAPILMGFSQLISFNTQSLEEIKYVPGGGSPNDATAAHTEEAKPVLLESVVQKERHTAVVTFQVIIEQPIQNASLQLFLVNPNWDFDRSNIQSFQRFLPRTGEEGLFVTATPEQIREATGTDHPIVAAILEPLDPTNGTNIVQTFPEFPFDLTNREEIRYEP